MTKSSDRKNINILVVDDEKEACSVLGMFLKGEGYDVTTVYDGPAALEIVKSACPDIVLLDIRMPVMDGMEVLRRIKEISEDVIVIMVTAVGDLETAMSAVKGGASDFLRKPINLFELEISIERALDKRRIVFENREYQERLEEKVAEQTAVLRKLYFELKKANLDIVRALSETIEAKDPYTKGHCGRVALYSLKLGKAMGLSQEQLETLEYGALLHDIGKIGIHGAVLNKPGKLNEDEYKHVKTHPETGDRIILNIDLLKDARTLVRQHHERYDGKGYPDGLGGGQLGIPARIIIIADAYDALTSDRPYRKGMPHDRAISILRENRGTQFDPEILDIFITQELYQIEERTNE